MKRIKLFHVYFIFIVVGTFILMPLLDNYSIIFPEKYSSNGVAMVLITRFGGAVVLSAFGFLPVAIYRLYIKFSKKQYNYKRDLETLAIGLVLVLISFYGLIK